MNKIIGLFITIWYVFENNYYNKSAESNSYGTIDLGGLHSWSAWFQSWNQLANTNLYGDCGKVE